MMLAVAILAWIVALGAARKNLPEYIIDLDLEPEHRFDAFAEMKEWPVFNETVWKFYNGIKSTPALLNILYAITDKRGPEVDEMHREMIGLQKISNLPLKFIKGIQLLYELQTLMAPVENVTATLPPGYEALAKIPWRGPGCTGIIARNKNDNTVYHARNLDFQPVDIMGKIVYIGVFKKNGTELFRMQMIAGYQQMITGFRPNGFALERNTRYPSHVGGNVEMLEHIESGRALNGWTLRKTLELYADYDSAVEYLTKTPLCSTEYHIISGIGKGQIFARDPNSIAHVQTLGQKNFDEPDDYIIVTNFDFFFHDFREYLDPTGGHILNPRRIVAQRLLNASAALTPEVLYETINAKGVLADTVFQAIMNVQTGLWNASQPDHPLSGYDDIF